MLRVKPSFYIFYLIIACLNLPVEACAERILLKDGRVIDSAIQYRKKNTIWVSYLNGDLGLERKDIDKILDNNGRISKFDYESLNNQMQAAIKTANYKEALNSANLLLEVFPDAIDLYRLRAGLSQKAGENSIAIQDYNFLISKNQADVDVFNNLGALYMKNGEYIKAQEMFLKALEKNPELIQSHHNLADLYMAKLDYLNAIKEYSKVLESEPNNSQAMFNLAVSYQKVKDEVKARQILDRLRMLNPTDPDIVKVFEGLKKKNEDNSIEK